MSFSETFEKIVNKKKVWIHMVRWSDKARGSVQELGRRRFFAKFEANYREFKTAAAAVDYMNNNGFRRKES